MCEQECTISIPYACVCVCLQEEIQNGLSNTIQFFLFFYFFECFERLLLLMPKLEQLNNLKIVNSVNFQSFFIFFSEKPVICLNIFHFNW